MTDNTSPYRDAYDEDELREVADLSTDVDDHRFGDLEPGDVYVELVQQNPEVCSNCFTKIRDIWFPHAVALDKRGRHTQTWQSLVRIYVSKADRVEDAGVETARNPRKACASCGSIASSTMRPLPADLAIEFAWNLSTTLAAFGVEHDPLLLAFVVAHRKRFPDFGSRDDDTYRVAVEYAIDETSPTIEDVLVPGPTDPARTDDAPVVDRPALPAGTGDRRRRVRPFVASGDRVDEDDRDVEADADVERASPLADGGQR